MTSLGARLRTSISWETEPASVRRGSRWVTHHKRDRRVWTGGVRRENRMVANVDPLGNVSTRTFDAASRVVANIDALGNAITLWIRPRGPKRDARPIRSGHGDGGIRRCEAA